MTLTEEYNIEERRDLGIGIKVDVGNPIIKHEVQLKGISLSIRLQLKDKDEKIVLERVEAGNSFLLNFMRMLYAIFTVSEYSEFIYKADRERRSRELLGREFMVEYILDGMHAWAYKEDDTHGIVIGRGEAVLTPDDQALSAKISNGLEAGKMLYLFSDIRPTTVTATEAYIALRRSFINHSGAPITIKELGVIVWVVGTNKYKLIIRDLIIPVTVPNDYTLDVQYIITISI